MEENDLLGQPPAPRPRLPAMPIDEAVRAWNAIVAAPLGKSRVTQMTDARRKLLTDRLRHDCQGNIEKWGAYCRAIAAEPFLMGDNDRGWTVSFDFALKQATFVKITEGGYGRGSRQRFRDASDPGAI